MGSTADLRGWLPKVGGVVRFVAAGDAPGTGACEALVVGREFDPPTLHLENAGTLSLGPDGWRCRAVMRPDSPACVWDGSGAPLPPDAGHGPAPARPAGLPLPGETVTVTLDSGREIESAVAAVEDGWFRLAAFPRHWVRPDGTIKNDSARIVRMVDADGADCLPGIQPPPGRRR